MSNHNFRNLFYCFFVLALFTISGCANLGPKFTGLDAIPPGKSVVYFYRQANFFGSISMPGLKSNGQEILNTLPTWSWWPYYIEPGNYHFEPKLFGIYKKRTVDIKSRKPGERFYVRLNLNIGYVGLSEVSGNQAQSEMVKCYRVTKGEKVASESPSPNNVASLDKIEPKVAHLYVNTSPSGCRVRIMNIQPKFHQGIELKPGKYKIETSAPGYKKDLKWIEIKENGDFKLTVRLKEK